MRLDKESTRRINELALCAFRDQVMAQQFLDLPNPALENRIPREMAQTKAGAREVEALLTRFANGDLT